MIYWRHRHPFDGGGAINPRRKEVRMNRNLVIVRLVTLCTRPWSRSGLKQGPASVCYRPHRSWKTAMSMTLRRAIHESIFVIAMTALPHTAKADIEEADVLLLWNHYSDTSTAIRDKYVDVHPDVAELDLDFCYSSELPEFKCIPNPPDPGVFVTQFHISPSGFFALIAEPVRAFLAQPKNANIKVIVTTRGLPAMITRDFLLPTPCRFDQHRSVESLLSMIGFVEDVEDVMLKFPNPYYGTINKPFDEWLEGECGNDGLSYAGKLFLVSRLDSSAPPGTESELQGVLDLLSRQYEVNKFLAAPVLDDRENNNGNPCWMLCLARQGLQAMSAAGWPVWYDDTDEFLHGPDIDAGCGVLGDAEEPYIDMPELVHVTPGSHHYDGATYCGTASPVDFVCGDYVKSYMPHSAGLFISIESYNGWSLHGGSSQAGQGLVLDWIAKGGGFTAGNVDEPGSVGECVIGDYVLPNLYVHGLSWGEAIASSIPSLGFVVTAVGDPLAVVKVLDPDLNHDCSVDQDDVEIQTNNPVDITGDGIINGKDMQVILDAYGNECPPPPGFPVLQPHRRNCRRGPLPASPGLLPSTWLCFGDVNGDAVVDPGDRYMIEWAITNGCDCPDFDVNGDGILSNADIGDPVDWVLGDVDEDSDVDCDDLTFIFHEMPDLDCIGNDVQKAVDAYVRFRGDFNYDGQLDCDDLAILQAHPYLQNPPIPQIYDQTYDLNCDNLVRPCQHDPECDGYLLVNNPSYLCGAIDSADLPPTCNAP